MSNTIITYEQIPNFIKATATTTSKKRETFLIYSTNIFDIVDDSEDYGDVLLEFKVNGTKKATAYATMSEVCMLCWRPELCTKEDFKNLLKAAKLMDSNGLFYYGPFHELLP